MTTMQRFINDPKVYEKVGFNTKDPQSKKFLSRLPIKEGTGLTTIGGMFDIKKIPNDYVFYYHVPVAEGHQQAEPLDFYISLNSPDNKMVFLWHAEIFVDAKRLYHMKKNYYRRLLDLSRWWCFDLHRAYTTQERILQNNIKKTARHPRV